jgi:hypothetical protein
MHSWGHRAAVAFCFFLIDVLFITFASIMVFRRIVISVPSRIIFLLLFTSRTFMRRYIVESAFSIVICPVLNLNPAIFIGLSISSFLTGFVELQPLEFLCPRTENVFPDSELLVVF